MLGIIASSYGSSTVIGAVGVVVNQSVESSLAASTAPPVSFVHLPRIGDTIIVLISAFETGGGNTPSSVTDNQGNTYTQAVQTARFYTGNECRESIYYATVTSAPSGTFTVTVNFTAANDTAIVIASAAGINASPIRGTPQSNTAATTSVDANLSTDSNVQIGDLVIGCACAAISAQTDVQWGAAATTGYINLGKEKNFSAINSISADYKIATAAGVDTESWSHHSCISGTNGWGCCVVVFAHE